MMDKMLMRSYTPTRPISPRDEDGTFDLTVKTYFPDEKQPGGAFSNFLHELPLGQDVEVCGPTGNIVYLGNGAFEIEGKQRTFHKVNLILGGSGLTPGYALLERVREGRDGSAAKPDTNSDRTEIRLIDANKSQADILLRDELHRIVEQSQGRIQITHVLDHPQDQQQWEKSGGLTGYVTAEIIKKHLFPPPEAGCKDEEQVVTFLCGPPAMIQKAALPALKDWGFTEDENCFGF
jgi:nitrate reductase (NAD(P)H)